MGKKTRSAALAINNLPLANIEGIVEATQEFLDLFDGIETTIDELDASVAGLKGDVAEGAVQPLQDLAAEAESSLAEMQGQTRDLALRVQTTHKTVTAAKSRIPFIIDLISLMPTLVLLWGILAQVALIYVAWLYRQTNRLDVHHMLAGQEGAAEAVAQSQTAMETAQNEAEETGEESEARATEPEESST